MDGENGKYTSSINSTTETKIYSHLLIKELKRKMAPNSLIWRLMAL